MREDVARAVMDALATCELPPLYQSEAKKAAGAAIATIFAALMKIDHETIQAWEGDWPAMLRARAKAEGVELP